MPQAGCRFLREQNERDKEGTMMLTDRQTKRGGRAAKRQLFPASGLKIHRAQSLVFSACSHDPFVYAHGFKISAL